VDNPAHSKSWRAWLEGHGRRFLLFARDQTRCEADARDVLQEALVEVWRRSGNALPDASLVLATIRRRAIDLSRREARRVAREEKALLWFAPEDGDSGDEELSKFIMNLPANLREVVVLKIWNELTFQQVADTLGIPLNTAASRYRYAIERLRESMKEVRQ
jgi:RNA polymerase sigma-70 factor (ECF subfamily)